MATIKRRFGHGSRVRRTEQNLRRGIHTILRKDGAKIMPKYINADEVLESITKINDVPIARINALADADKDGRVVILPCHVGDIVYDIEDGTPYATRVVSFVMFRDGRRRKNNAEIH